MNWESIHLEVLLNLKFESFMAMVFRTVGRGFTPCRGVLVWEKIPFGDLRSHIKCGPTVTAAYKMPPYGDGRI